MKTKKDVRLEDVLAICRRLQGTAAWPKVRRILDRFVAENAWRKEAR